jgi:hypothetical protein
MSQKLVIISIIVIVALIGAVGYFTLVKKPETITPPSSGFPAIEIKSEGKIQKLDSNLIISVKEIFEENRVGSEVRLVLTTDREYPSGCYGLAGGSKIVDDKIFVIFSGISIYQGPCTQALQAPSFTVVLPSTPKNYSLLVKYQDSIDGYSLIVNEDKINLALESQQKFTILPNEEFLRIPANSMWVNIGYTNRDKFTSQKKELINGLTSLGAKEFIPKKGNYAHGGFWGLTTLERGYSPDGREYHSGHYADDFLYFTFTGNISAVSELVSKFTKYECESGKGDCMSIAIWTWRGEKVFSWLLK